MLFRFAFIFTLTLFTTTTFAQSISILPTTLHLRGEFKGSNAQSPEWSSFTTQPQGGELTQTFTAKPNPAQSTLWLVQTDVKHSWTVTLNSKKIGSLQKDENPRRIAFPIPPNTLIDGQNTLAITYAEKRERGPDDINLGQIAIDPRPLTQSLTEARLKITVIDQSTNQPTPCRITIADEHGTMIQIAETSTDTMAVRPGVIYSGTGLLDISLPAGTYTLYAGRGFEYSLDQHNITLAQGDSKSLRFNITPEVPTPGLVSSDPHIHTLTFAGHGDCTIAERMLTIAGEHVELPISTEHNKHIDYETEARRMNLRKYFTPVLGNEMSSKVGHFNIFPILSGAPIPDSKPMHWSELYQNMFNTPGVEVVSLNHGRDVHGNRPLGPEAFNAAIGENTDGWEFRINAMEVLNSGAIQTDPLTLYRDWFALMNRGVNVVGVGSSDTHYVANHFVGQGRTYMQADDTDPAKIDARAAVQQIARGRALVSYGLLTQWKLSKRKDGDINAAITVHGPSWVTADQLIIFMNGDIIYDQPINVTPDKKGLFPVTKFDQTITLKNPGYDAHLVAIALGPGDHLPYWPLAKPYQPTSPDFTPRVLGSTHAIKIDGDSDGQWSSAYDYARNIVAKHSADLNALIKALTQYDAATAAQAAGILDKLGVPPTDPRLTNAMKNANTKTTAIRAGFNAYHTAKKDEATARAKK